MAIAAGFRRDKYGVLFTTSKEKALKLFAFADGWAQEALCDGFRNPFDPYSPRALENDLFACALAATLE